MRRDIGNEVIVAIAVVGVLAFALMFAIVLSLSNATPAGTVLEPTETPTGLQIASVASASPTGAETANSASAVPTETPIPPTATNTPTNTPILPTLTNTSIPPTSTNTSTN